LKSIRFLVLVLIAVAAAVSAFSPPAHAQAAKPPNIVIIWGDDIGQLASRDGAAVEVFIELRDANYPGSTYNLTYDPQSDQLQGIYYQAALQQQFEVFFVRMK
jgi:hypothetical protein